MFRRLLVRVVNARLSWIDSIPMGTLSNRFTNDIGVIDDALAVDVSSFLHQSTSMFVALLAGGLILPAAIVPTLLFASLYGFTFRNYLCLNRDANRIASTTSSPLFASALSSRQRIRYSLSLTAKSFLGFAEALRGVTTIRAFAKERHFRRRLCSIIDETLAFWYLSATLDVGTAAV